MCQDKKQYNMLLVYFVLLHVYDHVHQPDIYLS